MQYSISLAPTAALGYFTEGIDLSGANQQTEDGKSDAPPAPSKVVGEWFLSSSTMCHSGNSTMMQMSAFKRSQKGHPKISENLAPQSQMQMSWLGVRSP